MLLTLLLHPAAAAAAGWGLDCVWPFLLGYPRDKVAVLDDVCMFHAADRRSGGASIYSAGGCSCVVVVGISRMWSEAYLCVQETHRCRNAALLHSPLLSISACVACIPSTLAPPPCSRPLRLP